MSDTIEIEINNWSKHNKRPEYVEPRWFAMSNRFFENPDTFDLSHTDIAVWLYVLCYASQSKKSRFLIRKNHAETMLRTKWATIAQSLRMIEKTQWIQLHVRDTNESVRNPEATLHYKTLQNPPLREGVKNRKISSSENPTTLHPLIEIWNSVCGEQLPKVRKSNAARNKRAERVWPENTPDEWVEIVRRVSRSAFCVGKNERGWKATFDWLVQPETHLKVSEGKYDGQSKQTSADIDWAMVFQNGKGEQ